MGIVIKQVGDNPDAVVPGDPKDGADSEPVNDAAIANDPFAPTHATPDKPPAGWNRL